MRDLIELKTKDHEIARAIQFLIENCLDEQGQQKLENDKPVAMHSLRMAFKLLSYGYGKDIVMGAILHDLPEDAGTEIGEIREKFGEKIARLVDAMTNPDRLKRDTKTYFAQHQRLKDAGNDALIIAIADILDNSDYYEFAQGRKLQKHLFDKWQHFLAVAEELKTEPIYQELVAQLEKLNDRERILK